MKLLDLYKSKVVKALILLFVLSMILFPAAAFRGAISGLLLWFHNVLPNLLPFVIMSNLMIRLNITRQISKVLHPILGRLFHISSAGCYPVAIGFLSGIPMGAKSTADLVSEGKINAKEGQFLLAMCNNASPMFIIGYIAITQLKLPHIKYALFIIIYGSAILGSLLWRAMFGKLSLLLTGPRQAIISSGKLRIQSIYSAAALLLPSSGKDTGQTDISAKASASRFSFDLLDNAIMNGFEVVTKIGGYIILFSILSQLIKEIGPGSGPIKAVVMGIVEITVGISQVCSLNISEGMKIVLIAVLTTFGGFSGMAQTKSVLGSSRLSIFSYLIVKLISAMLAFCFALLYVLLLK